VCHMIHSMGPGGAESMLVELARAGRTADLEVCVVHLVDDGDNRNARAVEACGVPVVNLGLRSRWDPRALRRALGAVRDFDPAVVHSHLKHADLVGGFVAHRLSLPHVSTLHLIEDRVAGMSRGKRWIAGRSRQNADRTIAVSDAQRKWYLEAFGADPAKVTTIHNGVSDPARVDGAALAAMRREWGVTESRSVLAVNIAVMRPGKGHDDLLRAVATLPESSPLVVALVCDGELRVGLEQAVARDARLASRIHFAGFRTDVPTVLQAADLLVHPTYADALPTSLIEALATGTPTIATRVGGVPEVVGDSGELVGVGDVAALTESMVALARDPDRRHEMSVRARRRFESEYDVAIWVKRLADVYAEVSRERTG
jgi:glycosyltransferase involved in cell wall biosynthesis